MELKRYSGNPVLQASDLSYPASLVFNAGICKFKGRYYMVFRNDVGFSPKGWERGSTYTNLGIAESDDGIHWIPRDKPWAAPQQFVDADPEISRFYDPRLTVIEDRVYLCFAVDTRHGLRGGIAETDDFEKFDVLSLSIPDDRNMVLFPEKIDGCFVRLERPMPEYSRGYKELFDIWLSKSPDCRYWGDSQLVMGLEKVPFANAKIGPAAPPIKTSEGWLATFHATYKDPNRDLLGWEIANNPKAVWHKEYLAGLMLLDLKNPAKVLAISSKPVIKAAEKYELDGFRGSVIFPGGMLLEPNGEVKVYYGAADTVECLATATVDELLKSLDITF